MADEIEEIFDLIDEGKINKRFYKVLRVILQELNSVRFIFCGADYLSDLLFNHSLADVFEITKRITISRLDEESLYKMIKEPAEGLVDYSNRVLKRIWHYTKGHTYYSKNICNYVIDFLNEDSRNVAYVEDVDRAVREIMKVTEYLQYLSKFLTVNDKQTIKILCDNQKFSEDKVSLSVLEDNYEGPSSGLTDSLVALEFKDLIEKYEMKDDTYYQFSIEIFRLWYMKAENVLIGDEGHE